MDTPLIWKSMLSLCCICTAGIQTSSQHMGDIQTYGGYPNIHEASKHMWGVFKIMGHSNIQGSSKHMGASKCIGAYGHPLSLTKHALFVLCMYRGHPNIIKTYREHPNMWGVQTYGGIQTYRGHSFMPSYPARRVLSLVTDLILYHVLLLYKFYNHIISYVKLCYIIIYWCICLKF